MIHVILDSDCCDSSSCIVHSTPKKVYNAFVNGIAVGPDTKVENVEEGATVPSGLPQMKVKYRTVEGGIEVIVRFTHRGWSVRETHFRKTSK